MAETQLWNIMTLWTDVLKLISEDLQPVNNCARHLVLNHCRGEGNCREQDHKLIFSYSFIHSSIHPFIPGFYTAYTFTQAWINVAFNLTASYKDEDKNSRKTQRNVRDIPSLQTTRGEMEAVVGSLLVG